MAEPPPDAIVGQFLEAIQTLGERDQAVLGAIIARAREVERSQGETAAHRLLDDILAKLRTGLSD